MFENESEMMQEEFDRAEHYAGLIGAGMDEYKIGFSDGIEGMLYILAKAANDAGESFDRYITYLHEFKKILNKETFDA